MGFQPASAIHASRAVYNYAPSRTTDSSFIRKTIGMTARAPVETWSPERVVTPGAMCGYVSGTRIEFLSFNRSSGVQIFRSGTESQGLIYEKGHVFGASVTTLIHETATRTDTYIQYEKNDYIAGDFDINELNDRGQINYQGGHLIDYKFSAEKSHTTSENYIPMHFYYNMHIKEHLVRSSAAYIEIPLYSPNPPKVRIKGSMIYHNIPVGIIFAQIKEHNIHAVYYFPNNNMAYKELADCFTEKKVANVASFFKLKPQLYPLLWPALIFEGEGQIHWERGKHVLSEQVMDGMSGANFPDAEEIIGRLSHLVLNGDIIFPQDCFDGHPFQEEFFNWQPTHFPLEILGAFLVRYGLSNALKSEVISLNTRILFANVTVDILVGYAKKSLPKETLDYLIGIDSAFDRALAEINGETGRLNEAELLTLVSIYQKITNAFLYHSRLREVVIYKDPRQYFLYAIEVLEEFVAKVPLHSCGWTFLSTIYYLDETLNYLCSSESDADMQLGEAAAFLKSLRYPALSRLRHLLQEEKTYPRGLGYEFATLGFSADEEEETCLEKRCLDRIPILKRSADTMDCATVVQELNQLRLLSDEEEVNFSTYVIEGEAIGTLLDRIYVEMLDKLAEKRWSFYSS